MPEIADLEVGDLVVLAPVGDATYTVEVTYVTDDAVLGTVRESGPAPECPAVGSDASVYDSDHIEAVR